MSFFSETKSTTFYGDVTAPNVYNKSNVDSMINNICNKTYIDNLISNYYDKAYIDNLDTELSNLILDTILKKKLTITTILQHM